MSISDCRHFNGYKPCKLNSRCDLLCPQKDLVSTSVLVVHLEALGAVVRSTALLPAIKRKFPQSHITFVTKAPAHHLLAHHPLIDRLLTTDSQDLLALKGLAFDIGLCVDKSLHAAGVIQNSNVKKLYGFTTDFKGAILPATLAAEELWKIGLNDDLKFKINQKTETQLICEALELPYMRDDYSLSLTTAENLESMHRKRTWGPGYIVGINTGCSSVIPYKKWSVDGHRRLIRKISERNSNVKVVLLGGKEDYQRNLEIAEGFDVILSPTQMGLRDGLISVNACDTVITGDSLGMHMAIAMKKWVVAWFGPTCAHEIDLFERGVKILSDAECGPCWKRHCQKETMCYDMVDFDKVVAHIPGLAEFSGISSEVLQTL